jgi:Protein of unknown function (DUF1800)
MLTGEAMQENQYLQTAWYDPSVKWNWRTASHLLNRAGFGGTDQEVDRLLALGPQGAVESLLDYQNVPDQLAPMQFGAISNFDFDNFREARAFAMDLTAAERREFMILKLAASTGKMDEMRCWWINRMVQTRRPLQEKMTLFWHSLFVSAFMDVQNAYHMYMQNELFRSYATGNVQELTLQVSKDPAMLRYLNNNQNQRGHPNENYARELMELFTLGIGNYTEDDVRESARAWTGWTFFGDNFFFNSNQHDYGIKTFLGQTGNFNGDDIVAIIFQQPAASKHFALKLLQFFVSDDPAPPELVDALSQTLRDSNWQIAPVLVKLFTSSWFYSDQVMRRKIKTPVELVVGSLRKLNVSAPSSQSLLLSMQMMGQELFAAPNVGGWPVGKNWINTSTLFARYDMPAFLVTGRRPVMPGVLWDNDASNLQEFNTGFSPELQLAQAGVSTTQGAVDWYVKQLIQDSIDPAKSTALIGYLNNSDSSADMPLNMADQSLHGRLLGVIQLIMAMPEYQLC